MAEEIQVRPARAIEPASRRRSRIWSNLNLNGTVPARVRPSIGEWGPTGLPSTKQKKRGRWLAPVVFTVALVVLTLVGFFFWYLFR